jgi:hypothetical protein
MADLMRIEEEFPTAEVVRDGQIRQTRLKALSG